MKNKLLPIITIIVMIGCTTNTAFDVKPVPDLDMSEMVIVIDTKPVDDIISKNLLEICTHKYDSTRDFSYYTPKDIAQHIVDDKLSIYVITDINNKEWFINNFEFENYNCIK